MSNTSSSALQWLRLENNGTSDIFFSCLLTLLTCTFVVLHLNVPAQYPEDASALFLKRWWNKSVARQLRRQLGWAGMILVAPELLVSLAFGSWRGARLGVAAFQVESAHNNVRDWTWAHASFANMGGLEFEMERGGSEIPDEAKHGLRDILLVAQETVWHSSWQDITGVFNRGRKQLTHFLQKLSSWIAVLFRPVARIFQRTPNKGNAPADRPETPQPEPDSEMDVLDRTGMRLRSEQTMANEHMPSIRRGESQGQPSTARPPSVDLGQLTVSNGNEPDNPDEQEYSELEDVTPLLQTQTVTLHLNAAQIVVAQVLGILDEGPRLSKEDIEDTSKSSVIAKSFAALQLVWFAVRVVIQLLRGGTITQLELATCTYVLCALVAYALYWSRPQGVERPKKYIVSLSPSVRKVTNGDLERLRWFGGTTFLRRNFLQPFGMDEQRLDPTKPIPTDASITIFANIGSNGNSVALFDDDFAGVVVGVLFGALYCLGWDHAFPSSWEKWTWRAASVVITGSLIPYSIANGICTNAFKHLRGKTHVVHCLVLYMFLGVYVSCRVFMLVEMVRTLFI